MATKQDIYLRLPRFAQQLAVLYQSLVNRRLRYGATYKRTLALSRSSEHWTLEEMRWYQTTQLQSLLLEAREGTRYYAEALQHFTEAELVAIARDLRIEALPHLSKKTLKERTPEFFNSKRRRATTSATSGSTGSPLVVEYDRESIQQRFAFVHRQREWFGAAAFSRGVRMSGREIVSPDRLVPPYWVVNPVESQLLVSTYHLRDDALASIAARVEAFRPQVIDGYPTAIAQLARYFAGKQRLDNLLGVVTTAETLSPDLRADIESGLGVRVYDYYSASEGAPLIQQCEHGSYHLRPETGVFEILGPEGDPVPPGEVGELVVTSFTQWKTPLVRYHTGDSVRRVRNDHPACPCGRTLPMIGDVLGRIEDLVLTSDGRQIGMFSYRTIKHVPGIGEAQIVQQSPVRFTVRWVPDGTCSAPDVEANVRHVFTRVLGYAPEVELSIVDTIERGPNGKFRSTIRAFSSAPAEKRL